MTKFLIIIVSYALAVWLASLAMDHIGLGRLPGDFAWRRKSGRVIHFPLATTMLLSFTFGFVYWLLS